MKRYLVSFFGALLLIIALFLYLGLHGRDHLWSMPLRGDANWYRSTSNLVIPQMQDREIFYDDIGQSMTNAKKADVILLGHSTLKFGINYELAREFQDEQGIRLFNMNIPGLASGEFLRQVVHRWDIRPKIWILNASDFPASFFFPTITDRAVTGPSAANNIVNEPLHKGYLRVVGRNVKWLLEDKMVKWLPTALSDALIPGLRLESSWRSAVDGNHYLDESPRFSGKNRKIKLLRDQECHIDESDIKMARAYIDDIGGTVILTQVPFERWCPMRIREFADALNLTAIIAPNEDYSVIDGTHMDKAGSQAFTSFFLQSLAATAKFNALERLPRARTTPRVTSHIQACIRNSEASPLYVSLRQAKGSADRLVAPGEVARFEAEDIDHLCSATRPFSATECPRPKSAALLVCD